MFKNIGKKIMVLTTVLCIIGMVLSLGVGFSAFYFLGESTKNITVAIVCGAVVALLYAFMCWICSFAMYGYGKLIDNTDKLVKNSEALLEACSKKAEPATAEAEEAVEEVDSTPTGKLTWTCEKCGSAVSDEYDSCPICKIMEKAEPQYKD